MSIENDLLDAISSKGYNIENENVRNALYKILSKKKDNYTGDLISCRVLSPNEWNKYIIKDTLDGSITANNNSVWKKITPTNTNNSFGGGGCPTYYSYFYLELSQNNNSGNSTCLHEPTNCSNSIYVMGRLNNQDNFTIGNTNISKKEVYIF